MGFYPELDETIGQLGLFFVKCCFETRIGVRGWNRGGERHPYRSTFTLCSVLCSVLELYLVFKCVIDAHATER